VIDHRTEVAGAQILHATGVILMRWPDNPHGCLVTTPTAGCTSLNFAILQRYWSTWPPAPQYQADAPWERELHTEARQRTTISVYGPLWNGRPPRSAVVRGHVLAEAHRILSQSSFDDAAAAVLPWFDPISGIPGGPRVWLSRRTDCTPLMQRLINVADADRADVGPRLSATRNTYTLRPQSIPQLVDTDIYAATFARILGTDERTGRLYLSLCIARAVTSATTWSDAGL